MSTATSCLRDRMVRDAVAEVLRGLYETSGAGEGRLGEIRVEGDRVVVALVLTSGWQPAAGDLVTEAASRLQSLAELGRFNLTVIWERGTTMSTEQQLQAIDRYTNDVWNKGDIDAIDDIFIADRVRHGPDLEGTSVGAAGHKDLVTLYRTSLPDLTITIEAQAPDGEGVITRWRATGTNLGSTLGIPPTGRSFEIFGFWMHRFEGGRIAEEWAVWDTHGFLQQIGVSLP